MIFNCSQPKKIEPIQPIKELFCQYDTLSILKGFDIETNPSKLSFFPYLETTLDPKQAPNDTPHKNRYPELFRLIYLHA